MRIDNKTEINGFKVGDLVLHKSDSLRSYGLCKIKELYAQYRDNVKVSIKTSERCGYTQYVNINDLHKIDES